MRPLRVVMFAICGLLSIVPATAAGKCESGTPVDYDDVDGHHQLNRTTSSLAYQSTGSSRPTITDFVVVHSR